MGKKKHKKDPTGWLIKRGRKHPDHITHCPNKPGFKRPNYWQSHHVLPISSTADASIEVPDADMPFIHDCLKVTDWDTNLGPNLIGLPLKPVYLDFPVSRHPNNLPSHQIDHAAYTKEVIKYLKANIWDTLLETRAACEFDVTDIVAMLEDASTHWKDWLVARGAESPGTIDGWKRRHEKAMASKWYVPFSMDPGTPPKRTPPVDISGVWTKIFDMIK